VVFGLGDTSYQQYNAIGKFFNESLEELGGERVYKYGEANAEGNKTEDNFNEWKADMWSELAEFYKKNPIRGQASISSEGLIIEEGKDSAETPKLA
jgi:NADPH-ferrihemoprotein reductase